MNKNKIKKLKKNVNILKHIIRIIARRTTNDFIEKTIVNNENISKIQVRNDNLNTIACVIGTAIPVGIGAWAGNAILGVGVIFSIVFSVFMYMLSTFIIIKSLKIDVTKRMRHVIALTTLSTAVGAYTSIKLGFPIFEWALTLLLFCYDKMMNPTGKVSKFIWTLVVWTIMCTIFYMLFNFVRI